MEKIHEKPIRNARNYNRAGTQSLCQENQKCVEVTTYFLIVSLVSTKNLIQEEVGDELGIGLNTSEQIVDK